MHFTAHKKKFRRFDERFVCFLSYRT